MRVLFIGGTGTISSACVDLAVNQGIDLYLLNRGISAKAGNPRVKVLHGDIRSRESAVKAIGANRFDVVVDWVAYTPDHVQLDIELFRGRTSQYVFISSASVYQTPPQALPITESTIAFNPYWKYSQDKIAGEELLIEAYRKDNFPMTIVRPSHTYDCRLIPMDGGWTTLERMRRGQPVTVNGDGTSIWTLTHHADFARGFNGLLGNWRAVGETVHITNDEWLTWNQIYEFFARALGVEAKLVHVPTDLIAAYDPARAASLLGDKMHSLIFDNSKIKRLVPEFHCSIPYARGVEEVVSWYLADPARQRFDEDYNRREEQLLAAYSRAWPGGTLF